MKNDDCSEQRGFCLITKRIAEDGSEIIEKVDVYGSMCCLREAFVQKVEWDCLQIDHDGDEKSPFRYYIDDCNALAISNDSVDELMKKGFVHESYRYQGTPYEDDGLMVMTHLDTFYRVLIAPPSKDEFEDEEIPF